MTSKYISLLKAVSWRIFGSISTFIISYIITKSVKISFSLSILEFAGKTLLYYAHERIWLKVTKD
jgi:uncharacterized membrane protein